MNEHSQDELTIRDVSDPVVVMRRVVEEALALLPAADGAVVELMDGDELSYVCAAGTLADQVGTRLRVDSSLSGRAVLTGETLHCDDTACDDRVDAAACRRVGAGSMVCVPLGRGADRIGALKVSAACTHAFSRADVRTLAGLAEFISIAIGAASDLARVSEALVADATPVGRRTSAAAAHHPVSAFVANVMRPGMLADLAARDRVGRAIAERRFTMFGQPIVDTETGALAGVEALARFHDGGSPEIWFHQAQNVGLGLALQLAATERALELLRHLPGAVFLSINVGPEALAAPHMPAMLRATGRPDRVVLELTEHLRVQDYSAMSSVLDVLRHDGVRLAIDDTGSGFSSLAHIVHLGPDLIKLDRELTHGIDLDPVRRALAVALATFARDTGVPVIAEGIETAAELETVRDLGITLGQGYFIGRPVPIAELVLSHADAWPLERRIA